MRPTRPAGSLVDFTTGYDFTFTVSVAGTCDQTERLAVPVPQEEDGEGEGEEAGPSEWVGPGSTLATYNVNDPLELAP